jgi:peptide deformylase
MIYPIYVFGQPVLRKVAQEIDKDYPNLQEFVKNMFETMEKSDGVGLAAPQVGESIRLFVIDGEHFAEQDPAMKGFRRAFINAKILERSGENSVFNEGCLSLPGIREDITRKSKIRMTYHDENFNFHDETFEGLQARVIQHEYDHTDGKLFIDHVKPLRRKLLKRRLNDISKGIVDVEYKIRIAK